jgi:ABC-2 type transport system permease protein
MNTESNIVPESPPASQPSAPAATSATRPFYWSVRRELWENRSIYLAPLIAAGVVLFGFLISTIGMPERRRAVLSLDLEQQRARIELPYDMAAMMLILTAFLVAVFYCLDALHGERRDRSILFWKSLPVSDLTTVLSKATIPLFVLPLLTFAIIVATQLMMLLYSTAILTINGIGPATSIQLPLLQLSVILLYGLVTAVLWQAPLYGWLLLVSGWARRATFLWAVLPLLAVCAVEKIAFNTTHFAALLGNRMTGGFEDAFVVVKVPHGMLVPIVDRLSQLDPVKFLSSPGLWIGLAFAAAFLAAAVRLRRYQGPA